MRPELARIRAPELDGGQAWLNTDRPLRLAELRGHVVVLDFWTHGCINCIHTLPVLARIEERFAAEPVIVIGVHTGKFSGEQDPARIRQAVVRHGIRHPVVVDHQQRIWSQYAVRAWPTLIVVRPDGTIAATGTGELEASELEACIAEQLAEARTRGLLAGQPLDLARPAALPGQPLAYPGKVIVDERGNPWVADSGHHRIMGADRHGVVHTIIGSGARGCADGSLAQATFDAPQGLALTADRKVLYVADAGAHAVRRVDLAAGTVTTLAGTGQLGAMPRAGRFPGRETALRSPWDLALDEQGGGLYIAMAGCHQIWRLDLATGMAEVFAGTGAEGLVDGPRDQALLAQPSGLALSPDRRRLYIADSESSAVRVLQLDSGLVETLVGAGLFDFGDRDGPRDQARLQHCMGLTLSPAGLVVADTYNHKLRGINLRHGTVTTVWQGTGETCLGEPGGVAFDRVERGYIVADTNHHRLLRVARDAATATVLCLTGLP